MTAPTELDVDALAQEIRCVDGSNSLGAGALAEALMPFLSRAPSPSPASGVVTDEMVELAARAIDPDAFAEYERRLQYNAHKEPESERRKFADYYDTRPAAIETARTALNAALASLSQPAKGAEGGGL